jgi:DNA (cytosine-5)-methyltransferase 1
VKPRLLDLFCGAGGAPVGYARAGFDVTGVDIEGHADYPFPLIEADAMSVLANTDIIDDFDVITASPPCPRYSVATSAQTRLNHPDLVGPVRDALEAWGGTYVIENVPGAPLLNPLLLCGSMFNLGVRRHRLFESNESIGRLSCKHNLQGQVYGVYGQHADQKQHLRPSGTSRGVKATSVAHAQELMGIDWMSDWSDLADAIPPAYTQYVGEQLIYAIWVAA